MGYTQKNGWIARCRYLVEWLRKSSFTGLNLSSNLISNGLLGFGIVDILLLNSSDDITDVKSASKPVCHRKLPLHPLYEHSVAIGLRPYHVVFI